MNRPLTRKQRQQARKQQYQLLIITRAFARIKAMPLIQRMRIAWRLVDTSPEIRIFGRRK